MEMLIRYVNSEILKKASNIEYKVADVAPSNETELFNSSSLVIWSGASDQTIFCDKTVNWAFRAIHDLGHIETCLNFTVEQEIELGRIQASKWDSDVMRELIYSQIVMQAKYYGETGLFVSDDYSFTLEHLKKCSLIK